MPLNRKGEWACYKLRRLHKKKWISDFSDVPNLIFMRFRLKKVYWIHFLINTFSYNTFLNTLYSVGCISCVQQSQSTVPFPDPFHITIANHWRMSTRQKTFSPTNRSVGVLFNITNAFSAQPNYDENSLQTSYNILLWSFGAPVSFVPNFAVSLISSQKHSFKMLKNATQHYKTQLFRRVSF